MAQEIERKFLTANTAYRELACKSYMIIQGYLSADPDATVRIRIRDNKAYLTIKGRNLGACRSEWEYSVPKADAEEMMRLCKGKIIEKTRYIVPYEGWIWEVDEFHGCHEGLVVAEIELPSEDSTFPLPSFVSVEVTDDPKYYNSNLSK